MIRHCQTCRPNLRRLEGPLRKVSQHGEEDSEIKAAECEGRAVSFLYSSIIKDSVLVTAWSGGQLQIDALGDEIQPIWSVGSPPHLCVDPYDCIDGIAMICESVSSELSMATLDQSPNHTAWFGQSPPLLRLAIVDLALPRKRGSDSLISMFVDPLIPERIYSMHDGGIDSIVLHFLPFTSQSIGRDETMRTPSVHSVLSACQGGYSSPSPLCGFVALSDSFGYSWIVGVTSGCECIVLEMETWNQLLPAHVEKETKPKSSGEPEAANVSSIISKKLLCGPKVVIVPPSSTNPVSADSIEGRSTLHQYFKLFHENYVEYAHKGATLLVPASLRRGLFFKSVVLDALQTISLPRGKKFNPKKMLSEFIVWAPRIWSLWGFLFDCSLILILATSSFSFLFSRLTDAPIQVLHIWMNL